MFSQIDFLESELERMTALRGKDAPSVMDLQAQINSHKRQAAQRDGTEQPRENPVTFQVGMRKA